MNFVDIQPTVRALIAGHPTFSPLAAQTVFVDIGNAKPQIENALQFAGYAVGVWPPVRGVAVDEAAGQAAVHAQIVVRIEFEPRQLLAKQANAPAFVNGSIKDLISAVLTAEPELGGLKFQLAQDAFELVNFDEGILAYHIRFERLAVFGS